MSKIFYAPQAQSNHAHEWPFVIQGRDNTTGQWRDSYYGEMTPQAAVSLAAAHADEIALPGTVLRVVPRSKWSGRLQPAAVL